MIARAWWSSSCGRIDLLIGLEEARHTSHQGQCDEDVLALSQQPHIREQLDKVDQNILREDLKWYGAWDDADLADHEQNLQRLLWIACGDINEGQCSPE